VKTLHPNRCTVCHCSLAFLLVWSVASPAWMFADDTNGANLDGEAEAVEVAALPDSLPEEASDAGEQDTQRPPAEEQDAQPALTEVEPDPLPLPDPPFRYESPFSLQDCITILRSVIAGMPVDNGAVMPQFDRSSLRRAIDVVTNYLKARDDIHYNLVDYRWERVGIDSVTSALIQPLQFTWAKGTMPERVDAFSLEAMRGDVYLHSMMVYDETGERVADYKFDGQQVMRLRHSLPRREVFHLWRPTTVSRVELAVSRFNPRPRSTRRSNFTPVARTSPSTARPPSISSHAPSRTSPPVVSSRPGRTSSRPLGK
jgi:hypothetical protein